MGPLIRHDPGVIFTLAPWIPNCAISPGGCGQWKRFRRTLLGCNGAAWLLCCAGIILIGHDRFPVLVALVFLFFVVTAVFIYLMFVARREGKKLERKAIAIRGEMAAAKLVAKME